MPAVGDLEVLELDGSSAAAPHWRTRTTIHAVVRTFLAAAALVCTAGLVLFGWQAGRVLAISVAVGLLTESLFNLLARRSRSWSESDALLISALFACTLPPDVPWNVPAMGAALAVLVGEALPGGLGNYLWHPVALARVAVQMIFYEAVTPDRWPVLAPQRLLWGNLAASQPLPELATWSASPPSGAEAWTVQRTADALSAPFPAAKGGAAEGLAELVRDSLPPWIDTLTGVAGGAIGEACAVAVILAGLLLMWRGILRWQLLAAALGAAVIAATLLPIRLQGQPGWHWLPGLAIWEGVPVGPVYVLYHLTAGGLLLVVLLLACDPTSSPLTSRGQAWFGAVIGAAAIALRVVFGLPAAEYWALLVANTMVPLINRMTRRRVMGT